MAHLPREDLRRFVYAAVRRTTCARPASCASLAGVTRSLPRVLAFSTTNGERRSPPSGDHLSSLFTVGSGVLKARAPANGNLAPPGYYLLFVLDSKGVPSPGLFVRLVP